MLKIYKKIISAAIMTVIFLSNVTAAAEGSMFEICFDDIATNAFSDSIISDGSANNRVIEDGVQNKAYLAVTGSADNLIEANFPAPVTDKKYVVQFDIKIIGDSPTGEISLKNDSGEAMPLMKMGENSILYTNEGKKIDGLGYNRYTTVSTVINNSGGFLTVFIDGKVRLSSWKLPTVITPSKLSLYMDESTVGSKVLIDNIRVYSGERYMNLKSNTVYNGDSVEFVEVDETAPADKIYVNDTLDNTDEMCFEKVPKTNKIYSIYNEEEKNGYVSMAKETSDDLFLNLNLNGTSKNLVLEADFRYNDIMPDAGPFVLRDTVTTANTEQLWFVSMQNGSITAGGASAAMEKRTWYTVSVVLDMKKSLYSVYVNGNILVKEKSISPNFKVLTLWRVYVGTGTKTGELMIDNVKVYDGTEPRDISGEDAEEKSIYSDDDALSLLKNKTAIMPYSNKIYYNNEKKDTAKPCIIEKEDILVSAEDFKNLFGTEPVISGDSIKIGNDISFTKNIKQIAAGAKQIEIQSAPRDVDGTLMIPIIAYANNGLVDKKFYDDGHGMYVVANDIIGTDKRIKKANQYMFFDNKDVDGLKEQFLNTNGAMEVHPRIIARREDFERIKNEIKTDAYKKKWFEDVKRDADAVMGLEPVTYSIQGGRLMFVSEEARRRIKLLGFMYQITGEDKYAERCYAELESVCAFPDWHPSHTLDTGIMASAVGIGYDWIYQYMNEEQRNTIAQGAIKNGLRVLRQAYYGRASYITWWTDTETNWGIIVGGGVATLALAIAEADPDYCFDILRNSLYGIENTWYYFAPDGAWHEGPNYWSFMGENLGMFMSSYESAMGEVFGKNYMGLDKYGMFQAYFSDPLGVCNNFHDCDEMPILDPVQFYLADVYNQPALMKHRTDEMEMVRVSAEPLDLIYYDVSVTNMNDSLQLDKDKYYRESEFISMREKWNDRNALWLSTQGGSTASAHCHIDEGSFVFNIGGYRWAIDLGSDAYSYGTVAGQGTPYQDTKMYYKKKGEGHNIVVINPDDKHEVDITQFAKVSEPVSGENASYCTIDLGNHYNKNATAYTRGFMIADGKRSLTVRDEIKLKGESELYWFMHTKGDIAVIDDNTAVIFAEGKQLKLQFLTNAAESELGVMKAVKLPQSIQFEEDMTEGITKIAYKLKGSGDINITVKMSLVGEEASNTPPQDIPISEWNVNDAKNVNYKYATAKINNITIDGNSIYGFKPDTYNYDNYLREDGSIPEIGLTADCRTEIIYHDMFDGSKLVEIRAFDSDGIYFNSYTVKFKPYVHMTVGNYNRYLVVGANVSSEQSGNERGGSYDDNLGTRWSAEGKGEWIIHDLGSSKEIDAIGVALWKGGERQFTYDILVSDDGENFTKVLSHVSAGKNEEIEVVPLNSKVNARFVKYLGYGNTVNNWNNVIELAALKSK